MKKTNKFFSKFSKVIGIVVVAIIFYFLGYLAGHKNLTFEKNYKPVIANTELGKPKSVDFGVFWSAWDLVTEKFVGNYDSQKMVYGAIKGMVESLGDPYSSFLEATDNQLLQQDLSGEIEGIGAELTLKDGKILVIAPLADSPAEKAGIRPKDEIVKIDGEDTTGLSLDQAVSKIRGKAGTSVTLLINREGFNEPKEFKIARAKVAIKSVRYEMKGNIGYIQISQFGQDTSGLAKAAVDDLVTKHPKAIILDLRDNPGGYLDASIDVASLFMDRGVVVKEQYKNGRIVELKTTLEGKFAGTKVIVLVNEGSASASEIVAGALRDSRHATIIGKKTFGKGSVQELEDLSGGTALRITVAKWLTPSGSTIDKEGIKPDIEVDLSDADLAAQRDPQLERALEVANQ